MKTRPPQGILSKRDRMRIWMLLGALGLVIMAMKQLQKPSTIEQLDRVFSPQIRITQNTSSELVNLNDDVNFDSFPSKITENTSLVSEHVADKINARPTSEIPGLSMIKDKTFFRPSEQQAWFYIIKCLQKMTAAEILDDSVGEIALAQLLKQPNEYRGRLISLRGTALREEVANPGENSIGLESYHRLWIRPLGGGSTPFVVYCLDLPEDFPRGEKIQAPISLSGYFFKNWSYSSGDDLALAPVVVTKSIYWQPPVEKNKSSQIVKGSFATALIAICLLSMFVVWVLYKSSGRSNRIKTAQPTKIQLPSTWKEEGRS